MKGSLLWKLMYVFCALAGVLAGYGIFLLMGAEEVEPNTITKDSTLVQEAEDSVFFDNKNEVTVAPGIIEGQEVNEIPIPTAEPTKLVLPSIMPEKPTEVSQDKPELPEVTALPTETLSAGQSASTLPEDTMPSLASQWVLHAPPELPSVTAPPMNSTEREEQDLLQSPAAETITYPVEIFGQVPVINRSDTYVSYFEFAYDLIEMLEPEVKQRGLNLNALLAKFVIKALFCGVDIEKLDINAPIPRRLAALCLWLAAQLLNENGVDTTAKAAQKYVTDIGGCSSAEKKAVAYLYEQGILAGYQTPGQQFYPDAGLRTESGNTWLSRIKQHWKQR